ncbi:MAG: carbohydrate kinase family protein [Pseudoflavonifractor sp.]|nr:carbohydrate kinase family protein [Alloprevotella sp.]MCM1117433.1 carbohydrate kinase family protein [Pseudoflavonifractor sp.]
MRRIILIGECALDIVFPSTQNNYPLSTLSNLNAVPGGRMLNAAALLGTLHDNVSYVGEAARDRIGDMIISFLSANRVDVSSIDRYVDGDTPSNLFFPVDDSHPTESIMIYRRYPDECFDVKWPDVSEDDVVVFGSYFAIDPRVRPRLKELLQYIVDRKAMIINVPGFLRQQEPRITRVMPEILENLEIADMVVTRTQDLKHIYGSRDPEDCYKKHIKFYCRSFINIDPGTQQMTFFHDDISVSTPIARPPISLMWNSGALAGIISSIVDLGITRASLKQLETPVLSDIITEANSMADHAVAKAAIDHL